MNRKGAGTTMSVIMIIVFMLAILMIYLHMIRSKTTADQELNIKEAELMRIRDTASLASRSLETSRFVSTLQAVFRTGLESVGCPDKYWYRTKKIPKNYISNGVITNPSLCSNDKNSLISYISEKIKIEIPIKNSFKANDVKVSIGDSPKTELLIEDENITSIISDTATAESSDANAIIEKTSTSTVYTEMWLMTQAGNGITRDLLDLSMSMERWSDTYDESNRYNGEDYQPITLDKNDYLLLMDSKINGIINKYQKNFKNTKISITKNKFELIAPSGEEADIYADSKNKALLFHYDLTIKMQEGYDGGIVTDCQEVPEMYKSMISDAVGGDWEFIGVDAYHSAVAYRYSSEEIMSLVDAMINQESGWNPSAVSPKGAVGMMQILPSTGESECGLSESELYDAEKNIKCGTKYLKKMMDNFISDAMSSDELIRLALAAYNCGPGCVRNAISNAGSSEWADLSQKLPIQTQNYVSVIMNCRGYYQRSSGREIEYKYQWPTDSRRITSCFYEQRINYETNEQKIHKGIDIGGGGPIYAAADGTVTKIENTCKIGNAQCGGRFGNYVLMSTNDGYLMRYAHLNSVSVEKGQVVKKGDLLGVMGNTGDSSGVHLHFEIRRLDETPLDPCNFIDCTESNNIKCDVKSVPTEELKGLYYYYDDSANAFTPKPITLEIRVEDYLMPLWCRDKDYEKSAYMRFYWTRPREMGTEQFDLMCFINKQTGLELYFCERTIDGKPTQPPPGMDINYIKKYGQEIMYSDQDTTITCECREQGFTCHR